MNSQTMAGTFNHQSCHHITRHQHGVAESPPVPQGQQPHRVGSPAAGGERRRRGHLRQRRPGLQNRGAALAPRGGQGAGCLVGGALGMVPVPGGPLGAPGDSVGSVGS